MTLKTIITMAKDLELHEHYAEHEADRKCGSDPTECLIKTRIWQCIFACEIMVGGPQGAQAARAIFLLIADLVQAVKTLGWTPQAWIWAFKGRHLVWMPRITKFRGSSHIWSE